jgi:hypothetical protein
MVVARSRLLALRARKGRWSVLGWEAKLSRGRGERSINRLRRVWIRRKSLRKVSRNTLRIMGLTRIPITIRASGRIGGVKATGLTHVFNAFLRSLSGFTLLIRTAKRRA